MTHVPTTGPLSTAPLATEAPHPRWFVRWFVQYNPMFTASALCVMGGVLLLSRAMSTDAVVPLTAVVELYQWLLIGVAALLYRRLHEHRPGVILGLIALVFLADPTLQLGALAAAGAGLASVVWVALFAAKWRALEWAFRLRLSWSARVLPPLAAAFVATLPNARLLDVGDRALTSLLAIGVFTLGVTAVLARPHASSRRALGDVGVVMFPRLVRAAACVGVGGLLYQGANVVFAIGGTAFFALVGALVLAGVVAAKSESATWVCATVGVFACAVGGAGDAVALALGAVGLLVGAREKAPRVFSTGVLAAYAAAVAATGKSAALAMNDPGVVAVVVVATAALVYVLARRRGWSAIPALAILHGRWIVPAATAIAPRGDGQWGAAMLVAGFVLLPVGVVVHRRLSRSLDGGPGPATADGPSTPAAIGVGV